MVAIKGYYDGTQIVPLEYFPKRANHKVIITFLDEEFDSLPDLTAYIEPMSKQTDINAIAKAQDYKGIDMNTFDAVIKALDIQESFETLIEE
jgi:hypothetical protein